MMRLSYVRRFKRFKSKIVVVSPSACAERLDFMPYAMLPVSVVPDNGCEWANDRKTYHYCGFVVVELDVKLCSCRKCGIHDNSYSSQFPMSIGLRNFMWRAIKIWESGAAPISKLQKPKSAQVSHQYWLFAILAIYFIAVCGMS